MASAREIQTRMKSIRDTLKITSAMYMISSTKLRKAKKNLHDTEPYFFTMQVVIERVLRHIPEMVHLYFGNDEELMNQKPKEKLKRGYIVITADKGLAGAYNHNIFKLTQEMLAQEGENKLYVVGEVGRQYFSGKGIKISEQFKYTSQNPTMHRARIITERILHKYREHDLDEIFIIYTKMVSSIQAEAEMIKLLPLNKNMLAYEPSTVHREEFALKPSPKEVLDRIIPNYITGFVYGALVESFCSEQNCRMMAMDAANKSADKMLKELGIVYNRVRQAAITQEITEVISGAKSQKKKKKQ